MYSNVVGFVSLVPRLNHDDTNLRCHGGFFGGALEPGPELDDKPWPYKMGPIAVVPGSYRYTLEGKS